MLISLVVYCLLGAIAGVCPGFATPAVGLCPKFLKNTHGNNDFVFIKGIDGIWGIEQNGCV